MDGENDDFDDAPVLEGFGMGMPDFEMPDFNSLGRTMKMLSWLPAIISGVTVFFLVFFGQTVYHGLTDGSHYVLKSELMVWFLIAFVASLITAALVKLAAGRKVKGGLHSGV